MDRQVILHIGSSTGSTKKADVARGLKYLSLISLTLQNAVNSIAVRYTRVSYPDRYATSTVVLWSEVVKLIVCVILAASESGVKSLKIVTNSRDTLMVSVPSFVYVIQNNLLFTAASNLDVASYQISYQMKILATAVFFVVMLKRKIKPLQWASLFVLTIGVGMVQLAQIEGKPSTHAAKDDRLFGFMCIFAASCLSGFAGVYFEKILKGSPVSLWLRNVQLSLISVPLALVTCYMSDGELLTTNGFFYGYTPLVWVVIFLTSLGGLIVAVVIKYADNILKGFSTSIAIVIGCVANVILFEVELNLQFFLGSCMVISAVWLYNYNP